MVAGQGRDLIPVLATHPRGADVTARLVELDPRNTTIARELAEGLSRVDIVTGDASLVDAYTGLLPADLVSCVDCSATSLTTTSGPPSPPLAG